MVRSCEIAMFWSLSPRHIEEASHLCCHHPRVSSDPSIKGSPQRMLEGVQSRRFLTQRYIHATLLVGMVYLYNLPISCIVSTLRNIYVYSIYWDNKSDHKEIHRDSAKNLTLNSTSNMRCNLNGDIAYVHVCKYMSLDAPPPFNSGD